MSASLAGRAWSAIFVTTSAKCPIVTATATASREGVTAPRDSKGNFVKKVSYRFLLQTNMKPQEQRRVV